MPLLAVDGATPVAGVAVVDRGEVRAEIFSEQGRGHAQTLMVLIDQILAMTGSSLQDMEALAVTLGPGSFTGLRIAMATVKGLAMALNKPVVGVSTLTVLASALALAPALIVPVQNARKGEVYTALYRGGLDDLTRLTPEMAIAPQALTPMVKAELERTHHSMVIMTGDGYAPYQDIWETELGEVLLPAPAYHSRPRAAILGCLAEGLYRQGHTIDPLSLVPTYLRLSEAEYRLAARG